MLTLGDRQVDIVEDYTRAALDSYVFEMNEGDGHFLILRAGATLIA